MKVLGIDTSNYTTSAALWQPSQSIMNTASKLLPVPMGAMGLRQSEAVFHHTKELDSRLAELFVQSPGAPDVIGVSVRPRDEDGSYMPCFTVGKMTAHAIGHALGVPVHQCSHQAGHIAAAAYGAGHLELLHQKFIAFHFSGGTTEGVLVEPSPKGGFICTLAVGSLDLKAGQAVDRVGGLLGLAFPAGKQLDPLAQRGELPQKPRPVMREGNCSLSGIENQCKALLEKGAPPEDVARFCMESIGAAAAKMTEYMLSVYGDLPVLYAGGVMSNTLLQQQLSDRFGGYFAPPVYSSDNAAGVAILAHLRQEGAL